MSTPDKNFLSIADNPNVGLRVRVLHGWMPIFENGVAGYVVNDTWKGIFIHVWKPLHWLGWV